MIDKTFYILVKKNTLDPYCSHEDGIFPTKCLYFILYNNVDEANICRELYNNEAEIARVIPLKSKRRKKIYMIMERNKGARKWRLFSITGDSFYTAFVDIDNAIRIANLQQISYNQETKVIEMNIMKKRKKNEKKS